MSKKKATAISLPLSRTAKIMTSAVGVESVNQDIVALATKATEIFIMDFARRAYDQSSDEEFRSNILEYDDIQKLVHSDERYDFLIDTTPKRIKFSEALKLVDESNQRKAEDAIKLKELLLEKEARKAKLEQTKAEKKVKEKANNLEASSPLKKTKTEAKDERDSNEQTSRYVNHNESESAMTE